jgi:hypothetical protein
MIGDLGLARQEKSPAVAGGYRNCIFDKDAEIPYKMVFGNRIREWAIKHRFQMA